MDWTLDSRLRDVPIDDLKGYRVSVRCVPVSVCRWSEFIWSLRGVYLVVLRHSGLGVTVHVQVYLIAAQVSKVSEYQKVYWVFVLECK